MNTFISYTPCLFHNNKLKIFISICLSLATPGCLEPMQYVPPDFPNSVAEVSNIKAGADQYRCKNGEFNGKHISKIHTGATQSYTTKNPNYNGSIVKQYVCYKNNPVKGSIGASYYGVAFIFHTTSEGIVTRCTENEYIYEY